MRFKKVLVVEDDAQLCRVIARMLRPRQVAQVTAAAQAMDVAWRLRPELAILDIHLQDGNGLALIPPLRAALPDIEIGVISGEFTNTELAEQRDDVAANWCLAKPFDKKTLDATLARSRAARLHPPLLGDDLRLSTAMRRHIEYTVALMDGNKSAAARELGISRNSLHQKLEAWDAESEHANDVFRDRPDDDSNDDN